MKKSSKSSKFISLFLAASILSLSIIMPSIAAVSPNKVNIILEAGKSSIHTASVTVSALPPSADVLFCFDLTSSMTDVLNTAKSRALDIMTQLNALGVDINYGVISHMDYPSAYNSYGYDSIYGEAGKDYPYKMNQAITKSVSAVSSSINALTIGSGFDEPESYGRALYEAYSDTSISWRNGSKKIVLAFGDNLPHDNNVNEGVPGLTTSKSTGGDPGRDGVMFTSDDLDFQSVINGLAAKNITLISCQTGGGFLNYWQYWAGLTGGIAYNTNSTNLSKDVVSLITGKLTVPSVTNLKLIPDSAFVKWLDNTSPPSYSGPSGVTVPFVYTLKVPDKTPAGVYKFVISAVDSRNVNYGNIDVTITVPKPAMQMQGTINSRIPH